MKLQKRTDARYNKRLVLELSVYVEAKKCYNATPGRNAVSSLSIKDSLRPTRMPKEQLWFVLENEIGLDGNGRSSFSRSGEMSVTPSHVV